MSLEPLCHLPLLSGEQFGLLAEMSKVGEMDKDEFFQQLHATIDSRVDAKLVPVNEKVDGLSTRVEQLTEAVSAIQSSGKLIATAKSGRHHQGLGAIRMISSWRHTSSSKTSLRGK